MALAAAPEASAFSKTAKAQSLYLHLYVPVVMTVKACCHICGHVAKDLIHLNDQIKQESVSQTWLQLYSIAMQTPDAGPSSRGFAATLELRLELTLELRAW